MTIKKLKDMPYTTVEQVWRMREAMLGEIDRLSAEIEEAVEELKEIMRTLHE